MNTETKIHLSKLETELIKNKEWILTKRSIIDKVVQLFGAMHETYKQVLENEKTLPPEFYKEKGGKISKGENYLGLPYVILDYPALFSKQNVFAIRTMFWWGNFFSISLHISGKNFQIKNDFSRLLTYLAEKKFFVCVNENEWQHDFNPSNYISVAELDEQKQKEIFKRNFFKISKSIKLNEWNETPEFLEKTFKEIIDFLKISHPDDEKDPSPAFPIIESGL
jgi:hypothetical protein